MIASLLDLDRSVSDAAGDLHWAPLVALFTALSWWPVKLVPYVLAGLWRDARARTLPWTTAAILLAFSLASLLTTAIKNGVDRVRPDASDAAVQLPTSPSFPSGHASTAFAAAVATAILIPPLRVPALVLATLVAVSRVYLGVHFPLDVLAGGLLGAAVGAAVALPVVRRRPSARPARS